MKCLEDRSDVFISPYFHNDPGSIVLNNLTSFKIHAGDPNEGTAVVEPGGDKGM